MNFYDHLKGIIAETFNYARAPGHYALAGSTQLTFNIARFIDRAVVRVSIASPTVNPSSAAPAIGFTKEFWVTFPAREDEFHSAAIAVSRRVSDFVVNCQNEFCRWEAFDVDSNRS